MTPNARIVIQEDGAPGRDLVMTEAIPLVVDAAPANDTGPVRPVGEAKFCGDCGTLDSAPLFVRGVGVLCRGCVGRAA